MIRATIYEVHSRERTRYALTQEGADRIASTFRGTVLVFRATVEAPNLARLLCAILNGDAWVTRYEVVGLNAATNHPQQPRLALVRGSKE